MFVRDAEAMTKDVVINILTSEPNQPRVIYEVRSPIMGDIEALPYSY